MVTISLLLYFSLQFALGGSVKITVMTFNCWFGGTSVENGIQKIANQIRLANPDIVALQEMDVEKVQRVVGFLNVSEWHICDNTNVYFANDPFIITKFQIVRQYSPGPGVRNVGCKVIADPANPERSALNLWNWHLTPYPYGPYDACLFETAKDDRDLMNVEFDPVDSYSYKRLNTVQRLLQHEPFALSMSRSHFEPMIITGDFNSPSHLDWVEASRTLHCNRTFEWPVTKLLDGQGFSDSYRTMYPNPATHAGVTWSPLYKFNTDVPSKPEPLDRIDMILFKGASLRPLSSRVYDSNERLSGYPYHWANSWPSDHSAVISEFDYFF